LLIHYKLKTAHQRQLQNINIKTCTKRRPSLQTKLNGAILLQQDNDGVELSPR